MYRARDIFNATLFRELAALKFVYDFTEGKKDLLGGKGANLAEMTNLGLPVPPGFTITTDACRHYPRHGQLVELAVRTGRAARPGRSASPIARLKAGRAAVARRGSDTR
jgi:hypothetical protein